MGREKFVCVSNQLEKSLILKLSLNGESEIF